MMLSKCAICGNKKPKFIKKLEAKGLLSNSGFKTPGITYSSCGPFTKTKERIQNLKKQEMQNIST